jgi:hypothetical protein
MEKLLVSFALSALFLKSLCDPLSVSLPLILQKFASRKQMVPINK